MAYIKVQEDGRIAALSHTRSLGDGSIEVGNIDFIKPGTSYEYRYIDGEFVHSPLAAEHVFVEPTSSNYSGVLDGLLLQSESGKVFKITVSDDGELSAVAVTI